MFISVVCNKLNPITVLGPQMETKKAINLMKVNREIKGLATLTGGLCPKATC